MLRILTQTIIVPTFVTKVTEYLRSGEPFLTGFSKYCSKGIVALSLSLEKYFTCDHFSLSYGGFKIAILASLGQLTRDIFRAINA